MAVFAYVAVETDRSLRKGTIVADTPRLARDALRSRGMRVQTLLPSRKRNAEPAKPADEQAQPAAPSQSLTWRPRSRFNHLTTSFVRELATLLGVGTPVLEAIDIIAEQYTGRFHAVLLMLRDRVAGGASLAEAMGEHHDVFDEMTLNIVEVGENSGSLENVLERLADFKERAQMFKDRVGTAMLYPCIVLVMAVSVCLFLMTFVVPKLLSGIIAAKREIPLVTRIVKTLSDVLINDWWAVIVGIAAIVVPLALILKSKAGRRRWHRWQLHVPIIGDIIRKQAIVRVAVVMAALIRSGVVFGRALEIARRGTRQLVIREALEKCESAVDRGQDIAAALASTGAFPRVVVQIFAVGQQSGRLEEMLERLASDYDRQLSTASQRLTAVLEPVLILGLVVLVGFIAFATVLPMLEATNAF